MSVLGISTKGNPEQAELIRLIMQTGKNIIFCEAPAGTGKTFISLATALQMQLEKRYKKIIYTRNPIQLGENMGFLPGGLEEKFDPFMAPLHDSIDSICNKSSHKLIANDLSYKVDVCPIAFMRGRNIGDDTICIVDEAQNCSLEELKTLLTRISTYSKIIVLGSNKQIDNPRIRRKGKSDFQKVYEAMEHLPYVGVVHLTQSMRSPWCVEIDEILSSIKED